MDGILLVFWFGRIFEGVFVFNIIFDCGFDEEL